MSEIILANNDNRLLEEGPTLDDSYEYLIEQNEESLNNANDLNANNDIGVDVNVDSIKEGNEDKHEYERIVKESPLTTIELSNDNSTSNQNTKELNSISANHFLVSQAAELDETITSNEQFTRSGSDLEKLEQTIKITNFLDDAYKFGANAIDLSKKALDVVPMYMNKLDNLQFLYLSGNNLVELPLDFFSVFRLLQWLDLRDNKLTDIPTYGLSKHENLRYLLLENNKIQRLPVELGYVCRLKALNLYKNEIIFPPAKVISKGIRLIKKYLRENDELNKVNNEIEKYRQTKQREMTELDVKNKSELFKDLWDSEENEDDNNEYYEHSVQNHPQQSQLQQQQQQQLQKKFMITNKQQPYRQPSAGSSIRQTSSLVNSQAMMISYNNYNRKQGHATTLDIPLVDNVSKTLRPLTELKNERMAQAKAQANNVSQKNMRPRRLLSITDGNQKTDSMVYKNYELENALKNDRAEKYMKKKQDIDTKLQKIKDTEVVDEFRDELKESQKKMKYKQLIKGIDYNEPTRLAPFDIDDDHMMIMSNESRARLDQELKKARMQSLSPMTLTRLAEERHLRDRALQQKIREYTNKLNARRNGPKGSSPRKDRIEAAKDLRELKKIEKELEQRRMDFQYKYKAFTGDMVYGETAKLSTVAKAHHFLPPSHR